MEDRSNRPVVLNIKYRSDDARKDHKVNSLYVPENDKDHVNQSRIEVHGKKHI